MDGLSRNSSTIHQLQRGGEKGGKKEINVLWPKSPPTTARQCSALLTTQESCKVFSAKTVCVLKHLVRPVGWTAAELIHLETEGEIKMELKAWRLCWLVLNPLLYKKIIQLLPTAHETTLVPHWAQSQALTSSYPAVSPQSTVEDLSLIKVHCMNE